MGRADDRLQDMLSDVLDSALLDVHTAAPGIVVSYDATKQTAVVQPAIKRAIDGELEVYPAIPDVPVAWPSAGGFLVHLPLAKGDTVMLVFAESSWSAYRETGQISPPGDHARHSAGYPVAFPFSIHPPSASGAQIVAPSPITVGDDLTAQFVVLADKLVTWLAAHVHTTTTPGNPTSPPVTLPTAAALASTKLKAE